MLDIKFFLFLLVSLPAPTGKGMFVEEGERERKSCWWTMVESG